MNKKTAPAQSSHTISQKPLLGRRPAVRRKPVNSAPPAPHEWADKCATSIPERLELYGEARPKPPTLRPRPEKHQKSFTLLGQSFLDGIRVAQKRLQSIPPRFA